MNIKVNGESRTVNPGTTVKQLLDELGVNKRALAVEINREVAPAETHESRQVEDGDSLEIVTLVGGG